MSGERERKEEMSRVGGRGQNEGVGSRVGGKRGQ
jgi:hypothetical protein